MLLEKAAVGNTFPCSHLLKTLSSYSQYNEVQTQWHPKALHNMLECKVISGHSFLPQLHHILTLNNCDDAVITWPLPPFPMHIPASLSFAHVISPAYNASPSCLPRALRVPMAPLPWIPHHQPGSHHEPTSSPTA